MNVRFLQYYDGNLWYETEAGFRFPVPVAEVGTMTCLAEDRVENFAEWIHRHQQVMGIGYRKAQNDCS
jgi:hypothetical protein